VGDRLFLETLVRHVEENSLGQSRASTLPLLRRPSETPTFDFFRGASLPPDVAEEIGYGSLTGDDNQPEHIIDGGLVTPTVERSSSRSNNQLLLLRSPHPPSSFAPAPIGVFHPRHSTQSAYSTATSCYDPRDFQISSFSESVLSATSPLFYQPSRNATPTSPAPPVPDTQVIRRKSNRISSQSVIPTQARSQAGSLKVSIRTEDGMEDLEFPSPPRWSGCWFSDHTNNQTPQPPTPDGDQSDEYEGEDDIAVTIAALAEASRESLTDSIAESRSTSPLPIPHVRTFGSHATSFLSLRSHPELETSKPLVKEGISSFEDYDERHEAMESVCSTFADVSLSTAVTFEGNDPLPDKDSFTDPSLMRLRAHA
jgi:hypothetical protein